MIDTAEQPDKSPPGEHQSETPSLNERHPDWPVIDVSFYFAPHANATDMAKIESYLEQADVYLYENVAPDSTLKDDLADLSNNPSYPLEEIGELSQGGRPFRDSAMWPVIKAIYGTGKVIDSIDLGDNSSANDLRARLAERVLRLTVDKNSTFDEKVDEMRAQMRAQTAVHEERETIMADTFEDKIEEILEQNPGLRTKSHLNVLISMGSYHTRLRHAFTARGIPSHQHFPTKPYIYDYEVELSRTYAFGREPSRELLERAYAEALLKHASKIDRSDPTISTDAFSASLRSLTSQLDKEQMLELHEMNRRGQLTTKKVNFFLKANGLDPLPQTPEGRKRRFGRLLMWRRP